VNSERGATTPDSPGPDDRRAKIDPGLDTSPRDRVTTEPVSARTDAVRLSRPALTRRSRGGIALAGLPLVAVIVLVASLAIRGTTTGGSEAGARGAIGSAGGSDVVATASTSATPLTTESAATSPTPPPPSPSTGPAAGNLALSPGFSPTGSMNSKADGPNGDTATLLGDGHVLIVHGRDPTVELYDPASGTFSPTGSMSATRFGHTATLLQDGRVLVAGGYTYADAASAVILASAELYDPQTGTFGPTGAMSVPREFHTATLLPDGRVLIAGGITTSPLAMTASSETLASAELYDPKTGTFIPTGSMSTFRDEYTATLLPDGRVLVVGGGGEGYASLATAELYDPATGAFSPTGSMTSGRWLHTATLLPDGRVLITGGRTPTDSVYATAELYSPTTGRFNRTGPMHAGRQQHTATLLPDGRVLITGGFEQNGAAGQALSSTELYDPVTGKFTPAGSMGNPRMEQTATLLNDGRVLIAGGGALTADPKGGEVGSASAVLYQP
jgi:hypothetical protein